MGEAVLSIWDQAKGVAHDFTVTWKNSPRTDASVQIPKGYEPEWKLALETLRRDHKDGVVLPYPNLDVEVPIKNVNKDAHGFFALAVEVFGVRQVGWREPPPMPKQEETDPEVEQ